MKFKVGDKVRCLIEQGPVLKKGKIYKVIEIFSIDKEVYLSFDGKEWGEGWLEERFELAEQPEPQVGDVWGSEDKSRVVRVVAKFERNDITWISFLRLNGEYKGVATYDTNELFAIKCPLLLHRPPKKQPRPKKQPKLQQKQPKKQEEVWEPVTAQGIDSRRCFRKGNSVKWVKQGEYEGIATCNKKDEFDLFFGIDLAWHRSEIKCYEAKIADMIKEGAK